MFARGKRNGWDVFGNQAEEYNIQWETYKNNSQLNLKKDASILELTFQEADIPLKKVK